MLSFNNSFIGHHPIMHNVLFSGSDSVELFTQRIKSQPNDWYYRTNKVSYVRNSNGHRCADINNIDLNNYILFAGCSHSEGIGLAVEDSYPYLISKSLGLDYYNLGIGGSGLDVTAYNLITWFATIKQKPKLLVIQWPNHLRFISTLLESGRDNINPLPYVGYGAWSTDLGVDKFLITGQDIEFFNTRRTMMYNLIKNVINCPIIEIAYQNAKFNDDTLILDPVKQDYARDGVHFGILSNLKYTSIITASIKDKYKHELNYN